MWTVVTIGLAVALAADPAHDDADHDGWCPSGVDLDGDRRCDAPPERVPLGDCDDTPSSGATVHPGATESCAGPDTNCDGQVGQTDHDGDGFVACDDCDDSWIATHPGAAEVCGDQRDNDCDGVMFTLTHADAMTVYTDLDHDGWGADATGLITQVCELLPGHALASGDCDDTSATAWPGSRMGGDNCDGHDGSVDHDGDGFDADLDCNDNDPAIRPGTAELCFDGRDNNCDGAIDETGGVGEQSLFPDRDRDGQGDPASSTWVCAYEVVGVRYTSDQTDCDDGWWSRSSQDRDGDGVAGCSGDCDDDDLAVNPLATEVPGNGKDDDCVGGDEAVTLSDTDAPDDSDASVDTDVADDSDDVVDTGIIPNVTPGCACDSVGSGGATALLLAAAVITRRRRGRVLHA